jgi:hypothetical protein
MTQTNIMNGTIQFSEANFIPRQFTFKAVMFFDKGKSDVHDKILRKMIQGTPTVTCRDMGDPFKANITVKKDRNKPRSIELEFTVTEIPENTSTITNSTIYEGTTTNIKVEEYTEANKKIVEAEEAKGKVAKTSDKTDSSKNTKKNSTSNTSK